MKNFSVLSILLLHFFIVSIAFPFPKIGDVDPCGTQQALENFRQGIERPRPGNGPKYVYSTNFIVHFDTTGTNATTRAYAESVSNYAEYSWAKQCDTLLWQEPDYDWNQGIDNRLDIYIVNLGSGILGLCYAEFLYGTPYTDGSTSYIEIDNNITPWGDLQYTVAHEFNHACQLRYSYLEGTWFMENCATWIADVCYDNINFYVGFLNVTPDPLDSTHFGIDNTSGFYEYGGALWPMFLQENYSVHCPRYAWERMGTVSGQNTLAGIDYSLSTYYSSNLITALKKYAVWRYFTGTRADVTYHFSESNLWPTSLLLSTHNSYPTSGNQGSRPPDGPGGTDFIRFNPGSGVLNITFDGQNSYKWGAYAVGYRVPSVSVEQEISLDTINWNGSTSMSWLGNNHIALIPCVTHWSSSPTNLTFTYQANQISNDVGVTQIINPTGTIDSGTVVTPQAKVKNFGTTVASFPVIFRIGSFYNNTQNVTNLAAGDSTVVSFTNWTALLRGTHMTRCTTAWASDQNTSNDAMSGSVTVRVRDVGVTQIDIPTSTIDSTAMLYPRAQVRNYGSATETFNITFRIFGTSYVQTRTKTLNAGVQDTVNFPGWVPVRGSFTTRCSTYLVGDIRNSNDTLSGSFTIRVQDVGATQILAPTGTIDSGTVVTPQARVKNYGTIAASFPVTFRIGSFYTNTQNVTNLAAGDSTVVSFTNWTALQTGFHTTICTTALTGDLKSANNAISGSVIVTIQSLDVGVTQIIAPTGMVDSGLAITPQARVRNYSSSTLSFPVIFRIGSFYNNTQNVTNLAPGDSTLVNFVTWTPLLRGTHTTRCTTALTGDVNTANDALSSSVFVLAADVSVEQIIAPVGNISIGSNIIPSTRIANNGLKAETFPVYFRVIAGIDSVYSDDTIITIQANQDSIIDFTSWIATSGSYRSFVRIVLAGDQFVNNDTASSYFSVSEVGWQTMANVPSIPSGKNPKNGSCITGLNGQIYLLKANKTPDFYSYTPNSGIGYWTTLDAMPLGTKETGDGKEPKKGAAITGFNNRVYVMRGNKTPGFWYFDTDPTNMGWQKLENIPTGAKDPKYGSKLTYVRKDTSDCIFAMKGSKTAEFYLYFINSNSWQQAASPPTGVSGRVGYKKGSCLAYDGDSLVYVLKGYYGDFFQYNVQQNTWTELRRYDRTIYLNRDGRKKKIKDGAGLAFVNGNIYMLKGGNTNEFWKYDIGADDWSQMDPANIWDIPTGSGKRVKSGGALCVLDNNFYVIKGNKTPEFYKHNPPSSTGPILPTVTEGSMGNTITNNNWIISILPNPAKHTISINYNLNIAGSVSYKLYDITGTLVKSYYNIDQAKHGSIQIDVQSLAQGVYILKFNTDEFSTTRKLVIEK